MTRKGLIRRKTKQPTTNNQTLHPVSSIFFILYKMLWMTKDFL